jgi:hypothetical protein
MPKVARYAFIFLSFVLLLAAIVVLAQRLAGDSDASLAVPCALMLVGLGIGGLAWYFSSATGDEAGCSGSERTEGESEEVGAGPNDQQTVHD